MISQDNSFLQGALGTFHFPLVFPFSLGVPANGIPAKWQPKESGFQDDADNLQNDWLLVGNYLNDAVNNYERNTTEQH
jgi:hypothetical protein